MGQNKSNSDSKNEKNKKIIKKSRSNHEKLVADNINEEAADVDRHRYINRRIPDAIGANGTYDSSSSSTTTDTYTDNDITLLADKVTSINILRFELDRLPLDFKARAYFENDVRPLIDTLYTLGLASFDFSTTAINLANTNFGRSSKLKDALDLSQGVNEISGDVIKVLRCKVDNMLKLSKYDIK